MNEDASRPEPPYGDLGFAPFGTRVYREDLEAPESEEANREPGLIGTVGKDPDRNLKAENEATRPECFSDLRGGDDGE